MNNDNTYYNPSSKIQPYLSFGESILWCGTPTERVRFRVRDNPTFLFGIPFLAFALFWTVTAASASSDGGAIGFIFPLFGLPFIFVGVFMVFVSPYRTLRNRNNAVYAITDKKVYILYDNASQRLVSYEFSQLSNITVEITGDNIGNIKFQTGQYYRHSSRRRYGTVEREVDGFFCINDVSYVFRILNQQTEVKL